MHELEQALGDSGGQEAWRAAAHGSQRVGHDLATEQQQTLGPGLSYKPGPEMQGEIRGDGQSQGAEPLMKT